MKHFVVVLLLSIEPSSSFILRSCYNLTIAGLTHTVRATKLFHVALKHNNASLSRHTPRGIIQLRNVPLFSSDNLNLTFSNCIPTQ